MFLGSIPQGPSSSQTPTQPSTQQAQQPNLSDEEKLRRSHAARLQRLDETVAATESFIYKTAISDSWLKASGMEGTQVMFPDGTIGTAYSLLDAKNHGLRMKTKQKENSKPVPQYDGSGSPRPSPYNISPSISTRQKRTANSSPAADILVPATPERQQKRVKVSEPQVSPTAGSESPNVIADSFYAKPAVVASSTFGSSAKHAAPLGSDTDADSPMIIEDSFTAKSVLASNSCISAVDNTNSPEGADGSSETDDGVYTDDEQEEDEGEARDADDHDDGVTDEDAANFESDEADGGAEDDGGDDNGNDGSDSSSEVSDIVPEVPLTEEHAAYVQTYLKDLVQEARGRDVDLLRPTRAEKISFVANFQPCAPRAVIHYHRMGTHAWTVAGHHDKDRHEVFPVVYGAKMYLFAGRLLGYHLYDTNHHPDGRPLSGVDSDAVWSSSSAITRGIILVIDIPRPETRARVLFTEEDIRNDWEGDHSQHDIDRGIIDVRLWMVMARVDPTGQMAFSRHWRREDTDFPGGRSISRLLG